MSAEQQLPPKQQLVERLPALFPDLEVNAAWKEQAHLAIEQLHDNVAAAMMALGVEVQRGVIGAYVAAAADNGGREDIQANEGDTGGDPGVAGNNSNAAALQQFINYMAAAVAAAEEKEAQKRAQLQDLIDNLRTSLEAEQLRRRRAKAKRAGRVAKSKAPCLSPISEESDWQPPEDPSHQGSGTKC